MKDLRFSLVITALCVSILLTGIELSSISTALPVIIHDLGGESSFAWVSAAYTLGSVAILSLSARLADLFGRRPVLMCALLLFAAGSAVAASAHSINVLIVGRAIQGLGSGGIQTMAQVVVADLVPLRQRGTYNALIGLTFSFTSAIGPFIGGAIVQKTTWRWLFYLNLPLCGLALAIVQLCLRVKNPAPEHLLKKLIRLDFIGNLLILLSTTSCIIALTWAGVQHPWSSYQVLLPLILGLLGLITTILYEARWAANPIIPLRVINNKTTVCGYLMSFVHNLIIINGSFYLPVYFQGVKLASPLASGLYLFPTVLTISPIAIVQGIVVSKWGKYRTMVILGWCLIMIGSGLFSMLNITLPVGASVPFQIIMSIGWGLMYATTFVVLAPLSVEENTSALPLLVFARTFAQSWGVAIGASVLQNQLQTRLPAEILSQLAQTGASELAYALIPVISSLRSDLQIVVRQAFSHSLRLIWLIMTGFAGMGLILSFVMKELPLQTKADERWGLEEDAKRDKTNGDEKQVGKDLELAAVSMNVERTGPTIQNQSPE